VGFDGLSSKLAPV
jgi:hypothetical protein